MPGTLASLPALRAALAETAARGYAMDNEENEPGIVCYGVALRDAAGHPVACVSISTLLFRRRDDPQSAYIEPCCGCVMRPRPNLPCCRPAAPERSAPKGMP